MVVSDASIHNIMGGMESTAGVRLHNHRRKLKQRFDIIKKLGQGTYGKVQLGINKETGQEVAIKTIKKAKIEAEADLVRIRREIQIMSSVQHPNIIHIYEVFENREKMVLVMEYAAGGELYDFLSERKVLAEEEARRIFRQIATAVYYCHKHKICHRDLKLENILLDEHGSAKIADFGLSNVFDEQRLLNTFCGSPLYASPEIVKGTPYHGPEVDCWSLGVLLYTLVYGAMPFDGSNFKRLVKQISQGDYFEPKKPSPASPLIREMLTVTPARRADIEKICSHWWVNEGYTESCLEIAEELANQTPVRLDLLLSLAPPPPPVGSDKMLLTNEQGGDDSGAVVGDQLGPARCHSVGSLMELDQPAAERRLREFEREKQKTSNSGDTAVSAKDAPKRKLEEGISTEDAAHGGAKRKERGRRRDRETSADRKSTVRSGSHNRQVPDTEDNQQNLPVAEEKMDVDVDITMAEPIHSDNSKETGEPTAEIGENLKNGTPVTLDVENSKVDTAVQNIPDKESTKTTVTRDKSTRKSVKGSVKKKPPTVDVSSNAETPSSKNLELEQKTTMTEEGTNIEKKSEETSTTSQVSTSEPIKVKEGIDESAVEAVKPKVKKKKKVLTSSKSEENAQKGKGEVGIIESSLNSADVDNISSQNVKEKVSKTETDDNNVSVSSDVTNNISKTSESSKDSSESKTVDVPKPTGVKMKKNRGDLSLSKLGSSSEKSGAEDMPSPTKPVERRRSKIFENADKFNIFLGGSEPKSPTIEKPKKVFIPGVKVSDYKQAFERRSSLSSSSVPSPVKNSASKKIAEQNSNKSISNKISSSEAGNEGASTTEKSDAEKMSNVSDLVSDSNSSTSKQVNDSETLKKEEALSESSNYGQSCKESTTPHTKVQDSADQSTNLNKNGSNENKSVGIEKTVLETAKDEEDLKLVPALQVTDKVSQQEKARIKKLKDAVDIISNAIAEESRRESDPTAVKKVNSSKPPVPSSTDKARIKSTASSSSSSPKSPPVSPNDSSSSKKTIQIQVAPNDVRLATVQVSTPQSTKFPFDETFVAKPPIEERVGTSSEKFSADKIAQNGKSSIEKKEMDSSAASRIESNLDATSPAKKKSAKVEITLKSATLPRRRTSKAEIQLGFPSPSLPASNLSDTGAPGEYRTEVEHMVGSNTPRLHTQRSEVAFPVAAATNVQPLSFRSSSLEPEGTPTSKSKPREHIIPIRVERNSEESSTIASPPPSKPPVPPMQQQRSVSQRSGSLSRQSTQDSDTDSTISATGPEPIRKSPREYIIPIAVEGGGYVTPRAGSLEPSVSESSTEPSRHHHRTSGRLSKPRRMSSLLSDSGASEDEGFNSLNSPFATLQRHSSLGKDDPDDDRTFHRLRSSRPSRRTQLEHNDSLSSAEDEDDDDDDGFEILTAESLFSTLLSRVRSLTQRLNVEDGGRPGFPSSRLMSHLGTSGHVSPSGFWSNVYGRQGEPLSRRISETSQFSHPFSHDGEGSTPWRRSVSRDVSDGDSVYSETTGTLPRGPSRFDYGNISDDAGSDISGSYYTPSLTRRMQRHWHSSSQDLGSQSSVNQQSDADWSSYKKSYLPTIRKSSLGSLTSQDSSIPQHTSRRLARTLSLRTTADEGSNSGVLKYHDSHSRNNPLFNSSEFVGQDGKMKSENYSAFSHAQNFMPDNEEVSRNLRRKEYLPQTRRSLSLLDSKDKHFSSISTHRDSSTSDCGDYSLRRKPSDMDRILPPLPSNAGSQGRRRESSRSSSYARQHSIDMASSKYGSNLSSGSPRVQHPRIQEEVANDRPHHSSSLPSMARTKEKKYVPSQAGKASEKMYKESKISSNFEGINQNNSLVTQVPKSLTSNSNVSSHLHGSKFQTGENSNSTIKNVSGNRNKIQDNSTSKNDTSATSDSKGRSQIPSLLRFRSSSVSRDVEKQKKKDHSNKSEEGTNSVRKARSSSSSRSTPDRSILSKFFRQGSEEKEVNHEVDSAGEDKDANKKKRRISRFLRPDFFDTPREESVYAKEKDAKKAEEVEAKMKLKNARKATKSSIVAEKDMPQIQVLKDIESGISSVPNNEKFESNSASVEPDDNSMNSSSKMDPDQIDVEKQAEEQIRSTTEVKDKLSASNNSKKSEKSCSAFEKQSTNSNNKSRFLHSLEKKLEKFRSGDDIPSANSSGKSRVDKAIHSLREQSLSPRGGDIITSESHLLKRAVSVGDCCTAESNSKNQMPITKENAGSRLGNKVTSVLGLFRKLEDTPTKTCQSSLPQSSVLSRLRRTQSVYVGSQSDSVLLGPTSDINDSSECKPVPPLRLKKTNSNRTISRNGPIKESVKIQKGDSEVNKKEETCTQNPILKDGENKTLKKGTDGNTEITSNTVIGHITSNTVTEDSVPEGSCTIEQQETNVTKPVKKESSKCKTKQIPKTVRKLQAENGTSKVMQGNTKSIRPDSLTGLKSILPNNAIKVPEVSDTLSGNTLEIVTKPNNATNLAEQGLSDVSFNPSEIKTEDNLNSSANDCLQGETEGQGSLNITEVTDKGDNLKYSTVREILPTTPSDIDDTFDNSPSDDYSLNDDEIKFANVKRLDSYVCPADDSSVLSPADESESFDSWSVCSDFENRDFPTSPVPPSGDDVEESVGDRIRRKSFYSRFNDVKKKHRKSSLSSIGSLSSSYRDPNPLSFSHHPRNFSRKKDHATDYVSSSNHSSYHPSKPHRSQSLYTQTLYDDRLAPYNRKSPIPPRSHLGSHSEGNSNQLSTENVSHDMNGHVDGFNMTDKSEPWDNNLQTTISGDDISSASTVGESVQFLGGSMETLRMPRHFNHNVNLGYQHIPTYTDTLRRGSDSRLSRSTESNIGATIPKSRLPTAWDRHLTSATRFASNNNGVAVTSRPDNAVRLGSVAGETSPLHGKYNRYNSHSPLDMPSSMHIGSPTNVAENLWMESERPVTPH